jgi:hypothetical protein
VRYDCPDILYRPALFLKDHTGFGAVLLRELLVVEVMDQADDTPFLLVLPSLSSDVAHHCLYGIGVGA